MEACSVPNCKLKSSPKFHSPQNEAKANLWRKILKINNIKFSICDQHLSIICQSCMRSFEPKHFNNTGAMFVIAERFKDIFRDVIGYEVSVGVVCSKCHNCITDFAKFRNYVRKQQELRTEISEDYSEMHNNEPKEYTQIELESIQNEDAYNEESQFEVVEYQDEEYIVEMAEPDEYYEDNAANGLEAKQEDVEATIKSEPMDHVECTINELVDIQSSKRLYSATQDNEEYEKPEAIIKVEPIEYEYSDLEYQIPSNDLQNEIESQSNHFPKISNPRTLPASQNLKRKILHPETSKISTSSPNLVQASLRSALESSKQASPASKRMKFPQRSLKCQYCTERFDNCDLILEHIEDKHKFQCPTCNTSFPFKINLIHHQFMHHKESTKEPKNKNPVVYKYSCSHCMMKFSTSDNLQIHMKQQHNAELNKIKIYVEEEQTPPSLSSRILNSFKKAKPGPSGIINIKKES
ncbi:unnamed protein product [Chironomus riparius]|uniref:C2H2-type domain-containing protein n=1 Tax=Chironomus riparius TaxID=315576 RepID=A0A9N9WYP7_9DIPT|nr:unnamed protein product [Chironomus riparius]